MAKEVLSLVEMADARVITFSFTALVLQLVALHISPKELEILEMRPLSCRKWRSLLWCWGEVSNATKLLMQGRCCTSHGPKRFSLLLQDGCLDNGLVLKHRSSRHKLWDWQASTWMHRRPQPLRHYGGSWWSKHLSDVSVLAFGSLHFLETW